MDLKAEYEKHLPVLEQVCEEIQAALKDLFRDVPRIDRISTRVKSVDRFVEKAGRIDHESGQLKYQYPLEEIQDQIGTRVVVFYKSDVEPALERILSEFREVENRKVEQPDPSRFGYEAQHFVCIIPLDISAKHKPPIDFFELQVSTLFQHAWSEANHDLGYKPQRKVPYDDRRRIAWAAAQAWGADLIFDDIWKRRERGS